MLAIVDELDRKIQVRLAQLLLNGLQIVAGLRGNSQFVALNLHLDTPLGPSSRIILPSFLVCS